MSIGSSYIKADVVDWLGFINVFINDLLTTLRGTKSQHIRCSLCSIFRLSEVLTLTRKKWHTLNLSGEFLLGPQVGNYYFLSKVFTRCQIPREFVMIKTMSSYPFCLVRIIKFCVRVQCGEGLCSNCCGSISILY